MCNLLTHMQRNEFLTKASYPNAVSSIKAQLHLDPNGKKLQKDEKTV
jgi:hypothetical protein